MKRFELLRYFQTLLWINLRQLGVNRVSTVLQIVFMIINNLVFLVFWVILLFKIETISGFSLSDIAVLYAIGTGAFGLCAFFAGGFEIMGDEIAHGRLDIYLSRPVDVQLQMLSARVNISGVGDLLTALVLLLWAKWSDPIGMSMAFVAIPVSAVTLLATFSAVFSISFWYPRTGMRFADIMKEIIVTLKGYPATIFSGPLRIVAFSLIPVGTIATLPTLAVQAKDPLMLFLTFPLAFIYFIISRWIFKMGLSHRSMQGS
jgi:ABC-2 type transport system permease protein